MRVKFERPKPKMRKDRCRGCKVRTLTPAQVMLARLVLDPHRKLARDFGVHYSTVRKARMCITYKDVPTPKGAAWPR